MSQNQTQQMKKHKFNIFPAAKAEDYTRLRDDIRDSGYDQKQPVIVYEGEVLDGWNRWTACLELKITPPTRQFEGSDTEAIAFVMRTNKRRNLSSAQWATIAVEAEAIMAAIAEQVEKEANKKRSEATVAQRAGADNFLSAPPKQEHADKTSTKAAELFNTNRTYVNQAAKIKQAAPEVFEKVKAGTMTMQDAARVVRSIPTEPWLDDEKERKAEVKAGNAVVANAQRDKNLIQWAESKGLAVRVDRGSLFGNPFILEADGDRNAVCDAYAKHYLPHKPSIRAALNGLRGKVLICHCYPERCHASALI
jgi:hypothetical protein